MKDREMLLVKDRNYWMEADDIEGSSVICNKGFNRAMRLGSAKSVIAVLSDNDDDDHDYYEIYEAPWGTGRIRGIRQGLLWKATRTLGSAYMDGYRYLHFEIPNEKNT